MIGKNVIKDRHFKTFPELVYKNDALKNKHEKSSFRNVIKIRAITPKDTPVEDALPETPSNNSSILSFYLKYKNSNFSVVLFRLPSSLFRFFGFIDHHNINARNFFLGSRYTYSTNTQPK